MQPKKCIKIIKKGSILDDAIRNDKIFNIPDWMVARIVNVALHTAAVAEKRDSAMNLDILVDTLMND